MEYRGKGPAVSPAPRMSPVTDVKVADDKMVVKARLGCLPYGKQRTDTEQRRRIPACLASEWAQT